MQVFRAPVGVVGDDERAGSQAFLDKCQHGRVEALGPVEQHDVDLAGQVAGEGVQGVALAHLSWFLTEDAAGKVLLALIGEAQHDAEMARTFHQRYLDPQRQREREMLHRGIATGQLPEALEVDAVLDALCGPVIYRALTGAPIPPSFSDGLVTAILGHRDPPVNADGSS